MTNPFEDEQASYLVVVNAEGQHSLWPQSIDVPAGWTIRHGPTGRSDALAYVDENWRDMRPLSLQRLMDKADEGNGDG